MGQESGCSIGGYLWLSISHKVAGKLLAWVMVSSEGFIGVGDLLPGSHMD